MAALLLTCKRHTYSGSLDPHQRSKIVSPSYFSLLRKAIPGTTGQAFSSVGFGTQWVKVILKQQKRRSEAHWDSAVVGIDLKKKEKRTVKIFEQSSVPSSR
jgi:hypothetical protein